MKAESATAGREAAMSPSAAGPGGAQGTVLVEIRKLAKYYHRGGQIIPVLVDIDLDVRLGDFVALIGPSGSGKARC